MNLYSVEVPGLVDCTGLVLELQKDEYRSRGGTYGDVRKGSMRGYNGFVSVTTGVRLVTYSATTGGYQDDT